MGQAKRRKEIEAAWLNALDEQERTLVRVAQKLGGALPLDGACYRASLFMKLFLEQEHGIVADAVIGFVNDGTDKLYSSHAWVEFEGKQTDLTLCRPLSPEVQRRGPLTIHGRVITGGWRYSYHRDRPPEGLLVVEQLMSDPSTRPMIIESEQLHSRMLILSKDNGLARAYLDDAPDGRTYGVIARAIKQTS